MKIPKCKGARDLLPEDMARFRRIEEVFRTCCSQWGYKEIRTPTLEYLHLFTSAGTLTPNMLSRVYSFLDWDGWSGERVVLRPEGTIPSARLYVENLSHLPVARLFYVENMFVFEGTGQESRERWQCGVELIGATEPEGDAELILLALEILKKLGIEPLNVRLSHVGLLKDLLGRVGVRGDEQAEMLREILGGNMENLSQGWPAEFKEFLRLLLSLKGNSLGALENLKGILPSGLLELKSYLDNLSKLVELLNSGREHYQIDFASSIGFEYYTGVVFQLEGPNGILGKGGRYDELIPLIGGGKIPASGFALYLDQFMRLVKEVKPSPSEKIGLKWKLPEVKEMKSAFELASLLRSEGYIVELEMGQQAMPDCRWLISLNQKEGSLSLDLIDQASGMEQKGLSFTEVLQKLKEARR